MRYLTTLAALLAVLTGFGLVCGERSVAADDKDKDWGTIKGQLVWGDGAIPERKVFDQVNQSQDKAHCLSKGPIQSEEWVINPKNKGIKWAFVWLAVDPPDPKGKLKIHPDLVNIKDKKVTLDQPCCAFMPHALAMREGQVLEAKNSAPVAHNVNYSGHPQINPGRNVLLPAGKSFDIDGLNADERIPVTVSCNIHPWMKAWVRVFKHPYYAVTDENGNFEIKLAPAGDVRLKVWHEAVGWRGGAAGRDGEKITIKGGAATDLGKLELKP